MKKNHSQIESLIRQAIGACSYDNVLSDTKRHLTSALQAVIEVSKKRNRHVVTQKALAENEKRAKNNWNNWWEMIKKNAAFENPPDIDED
jgi:hypothetical protein